MHGFFIYTLVIIFKFSFSDEQCLNKFDPLVLSHLRHILEGKNFICKSISAHHKAVIFFAVFTLVFGTIGIITGACSPCFPPNSLLYVVSIFMTGACSMLSDIIFIFGATKDSKTLQQITLKEEPQIQNRLGIACYLHILATSFFTLALIFSIGSAYLLISSKGRGSCCTTKKEYLQQYR
ncbi:unnamed protein product [Haemonchus placei]|uniref:Uncharacterized protein n=1 Tax=Haemonchus placei TaxID=6290 RepID=A0A0N4VU98_HAEPC|nr:unnamed protein product [Haemonchus placei]